MIARELIIFTLLAKYAALSLPVSSDRLAKEDVKVMKCIVEVIANTLSSPHPIPVSQGCLDTLRRDERLISILRHQNFLKELQDIAVQGEAERADQHNERAADHQPEGFSSPLGVEDMPDRSMLVALKAPGERAAEKREAVVEENEMEPSEEKDEESQEGNEIGEKPGDEDEERNPDNHISDSLNQTEEEDEVNKVGKEYPAVSPPTGLKTTEEPVERETLDGVSEERRASEGMKTDKETEEEEEEEGEEERDIQHWSRMGAGEEKQRGALDSPHHSKEDSEGEMARRSPGAQDLSMLGPREPEERRDEDGSGSRKTEQDHGIESLAAIESELENVAQKLHELRRG